MQVVGFFGGFNFCASVVKASQILGKAVFDFYACGSILCFCCKVLSDLLLGFLCFYQFAGIIGKVELLEMWEGGCGCRDEYGCGCG